VSIIVSESGKRAQRLERTVIQEESYLQRYIYDHPDTLPVDQVKPDVKLLVLLREFPTPSGPIDALAVDGDGDVYLIETKLYKNPDKRLVIAQILDYGAGLWTTYRDPGSFIARVEELLGARGSPSLAERAIEYFGFQPEQLPDFLGGIRSAVSETRFHFIVLMDRVEERLKNLIAFVNANSSFDLLGVGLDFYEHRDLHIIIPTLYGAEVKKQATVSGAGTRRRWDAASFFADAEAKLSGESVERMRVLHDWSMSHADEVTYGTGATKGSYSAKYHAVDPRSVFSVYSDGILSLNFKWLNTTADSRQWAQRIGEALRARTKLPIPPDFAGRYVSLEVSEWSPHLPEFIQVLEAALPSQHDA